MNITCTHIHLGKGGQILPIASCSDHFSCSHRISGLRPARHLCRNPSSRKFRCMTRISKNSIVFADQGIPGIQNKWCGYRWPEHPSRIALSYKRSRAGFEGRILAVSLLKLGSMFGDCIKPTLQMSNTPTHAANTKNKQCRNLKILKY